MKKFFVIFFILIATSSFVCAGEVLGDLGATFGDEAGEIGGLIDRIGGRIDSIDSNVSLMNQADESLIGEENEVTQMGEHADEGAGLEDIENMQLSDIKGGLEDIAGRLSKSMTQEEFEAAAEDFDQIQQRIATLQKEGETLVVKGPVGREHPEISSEEDVVQEPSVNESEQITDNAEITLHDVDANATDAVDLTSLQEKVVEEAAESAATFIKERNFVKDFIASHYEELAQATIKVNRAQEVVSGLQKKIDGLVGDNVEIKADTVEVSLLVEREGSLGTLSSSQKSILKEMGNKPINKENVKIAQAADGSYSVKVTAYDGDVASVKDDGTALDAEGNSLKSKTLSFNVKNPSSTMKALFEGFSEGSGVTMKLDEGGVLSLSKTDSAFAKTIQDSAADLKSELEVAQKDLNAKLAVKARKETFLEKWPRAVKQAWRDLKAAPVKALKSAVSKIGQKVVSLIKKAWEVGHTLIQALLFNVPSLCLQAMQQKAANKALYTQITAPFEIAPGLTVQIPAQFIPKNNPLQGLFLYIAVPSLTAASATIPDEQLKNASYYVLWQQGLASQWGTMYATQQGAPGTWVNLNTGLVFMDAGDPVQLNPYAYLLEPTNAQALNSSGISIGSVQAYTASAANATGTNRTFANYLMKFKDIDPFAVGETEEKVTRDKIVQELFQPLVTDLIVGQGQQSGLNVNIAPRLLTTTLNKFRNGIGNIKGFLPTAFDGSIPAIKIQQFKGTGVLNKILGSPSSSSNVEDSIDIALQLPLGTLQKVINAQTSLAKVLAEVDIKQSDIDTAYQNLNNAEGELLVALNSITTASSAGSLLGLNSGVDVNAYGIYLYETQDTPIAKFMSDHRPISLLGAKDYVVFLDRSSTVDNVNIVPLFKAGFQQQGETGLIDFDTSQINGDIAYMCSLVTGITYAFNPNEGGAGAIQKSEGVVIDFSLAQAAATKLFGQIMQTLKNGEDIINQIASLANYATNIAVTGPYKKNVATLTEVDWKEYVTQQVSDDNLQVITSFLNGQQISVKPGQQFPFGALASASVQSNWLSNLYIYKVSNASGTKGIFGQDKDGNEVYDYVVPLVASQIPGQYQIMPLGLSAIMPVKGVYDVQLMVSLVTGQVYDQNYQLITGTTNVVQRNNTFQPLAAQAGQYSVPWQTTNAQGQQEIVQVAAVPGLPLATAFMPTFCNPYNVIMTGVQNGLIQGTSVDYTSQLAQSTKLANDIATIKKTIEEQDIPNISFGIDDSTMARVWSILQKNVALNGVSSGQNFLDMVWKDLEKGQGELLTGKDAKAVQKTHADMVKWLGLLAQQNANIDSMKTMIGKMQASMKPPYPAVSRTGLGLLHMPPMYWMYFSNYVYCSTRGVSSAHVIPYNTSSGQTSIGLNWMTLSVGQSPQAFVSGSTGYNLGQSLPGEFVSDVILSYKGWQETEDKTNLVAKVMQAGPFQFTNNISYNVYLNLPQSATMIGENETVTGNFFYTAAPVFAPTELFVMGDIDSTVYQIGSSSIPSTLTIQNCNVENHLGLSFFDCTNKAIISIQTGDVWVPASVAQSNVCYNISAGSTYNAKCNLTKIGTLDPQQVLQTALANQSTSSSSTLQTSLAIIKTTCPGLYAMIMNCQASAAQNAQNQYYPFYFAGRTLRLCPNTGSASVYAVVHSPTQSYLDGDDYWITCDANFNPAGPLNAATQYMISVISGNAFGAGSSSIGSMIQPSVDGSISKTPKTIFNGFFGTGAYAASGVTSSLSGALNNQQLFSAMQTLNNIADQNFLQAAFKTNTTSSGISAIQLPLSALQSAQPVNEMFTNLYQVGGKYYLKIPGNQGSGDLWYDFNGQLVNPMYNSSSGSYTYQAVPGNAKQGIYYLVDGTSSQTSSAGAGTSTSLVPVLTATPVSIITGYTWQTMLDRFGITIDAQGNQSMRLPIVNPSLPMTEVDMALAPGESSGSQGNMQCLYASKEPNALGYSNYYYVNTAAQVYLARQQFSKTIPILNAVTNQISTVTENQNYYVDLLTGEQYDQCGNPFLALVSVAYNVLEAPTINNGLDFSNPLFVWGNFDPLTESTQTQMLYQNTDQYNSSANGYNQYSIQPYSTQYILSSSSGAMTTYAYSASNKNANGDPYITQNGTQMSPAQTDMGEVLLSALKSGMALVTKTYQMLMNGSPSQIITVMETGVAPVQYTLSYTDSSGNSIIDTFQAVNPGQAVNDGSYASYNNPPLDETLNNMFVKAKPFCATVLGSRSFGSATSTLTSPNGGCAPVVCGLFYQKDSKVFDIRSAGILGLTSIAPVSGSISVANAGQYFAFYDAYNNAPFDNNGSPIAQNITPRAGGYSTYIAVSNLMSSQYQVYSFPGLYAASIAASLSGASLVAPYLCVSALSGTLTNNNATSFSPQESGAIEWLYSYKYGILSGSLFDQLKDHVNISSTTDGVTSLVSAISFADLQSVNVQNASYNQAAALAIHQNVFIGRPLIALAGSPASRYLYKISCSAPSANPALGIVCAFLGEEESQYYVDIMNGIVFNVQNDLSGASILYPSGFSLPGSLLNLVAQTIGNAAPSKGTFGAPLKITKPSSSAVAAN